MVRMVKTSRYLMGNVRRGPSLDRVGRKGGSEEVTFSLRHEEWRKGGNLEKSLFGGGANRTEARKF